jgi:hypothetical protein
VTASLSLTAGEIAVRDAQKPLTNGKKSLSFNSMNTSDRPEKPLRLREQNNTRQRIGSGIWRQCAGALFRALST